MHAHSAIHVLMAEDNPDDVELAREALSESKLSIDLAVVPNGIECLRYLRREGEYRDVGRPDILLLDLNMPRMDGREALAEIRADDALAHLPVVVLTTSDAESDIVRAYQLHANCYITKPVDFDQFVKVVNAIHQFWFTIVKLPPR